MLSLPLFLEDFPHERGLDEMRVHFHVPLFWEGGERLGKRLAAAVGPVLWTQGSSR